MKRAFALALLLAVAAPAPAAAQQPGKPATATTLTRTRAGNIRSHVGTEQAAFLLGDPDERIRGIERAAAIGTPEAITLLVEAVERNQPIRADPRALLAAARGLSRFADQERARTGLLAIIGVANPGIAGRLPTTTRTASGDLLEEGDPIARTEMARATAAIALAQRGGDRALEALYATARGGGGGQSAAIVGLATHPPHAPGFFGTAGASLNVPTLRLLGRLGDLRALDVLHAAARSTDVNVRCAALISLAELGDERAGPLARAAIAETDVRLRAAAGEVFILLAAPERFKATTALIADDATVSIGVHMAERVYAPEITKLVAARANEGADRELRKDAIRALGRSPDEGAAKALVAPQLLGDPELAYLAVLALARSPAPNASALVGGLLPTRLASLAVRAYVVRALVRGERLSSSDDAIFKLARSAQGHERALGVFAKVALGEADVDAFIDDKDPRVRRAAAMGSLAVPARDAADRDRALIRRLGHEEDPITRQVIAIGLLGGDPDAKVTTSDLIERAESGGGDAALATYALIRRADESLARKVTLLLGSKDAVLRAHAARGLAASALPDATGRLADLYTWETEVDVRRAAIAAIAARTQDASAPARKNALALASELDPDAAVRSAAKRAIAGATSPFAPARVAEAAWLRITLDGGAAPGEPYVGSIVRSDGVAVPIVFDEEGFAVVPGLPPGESRLVLAPRFPAAATATVPAPAAKK
ncbi:MAG: HEAT repeat domain-containing protein [Labilithrix sp.]|nr:HEAT repeat domain-containing protein [Labilithrix sp.]MCW5817627.1 HEAT repeat domain-containing protein [Labilithrix sp.]